jgi:hypothetical protein
MERLLRRLRQRCFESDKAAALIDPVKARLMPAWDADDAARRSRYVPLMYRCE